MIGVGDVLAQAGIYGKVIIWGIVIALVIVFLFLWLTFKDTVMVYQRMNKTWRFLRKDKGKQGKKNYMLFWSRKKCAIPRDEYFLPFKKNRVVHLGLWGDTLVPMPIWEYSVNPGWKFEAPDHDIRSYMAEEAVATKDSIFSGVFERYAPLIMTTLSLSISLIIVILTLKFVGDTLSSTTNQIGGLADRIANLAQSAGSSAGGGAAP